MALSVYSENTLVEQPAIQLFAGLGWETVIGGARLGWITPPRRE